eukprot:1160026-Pelagomonas_calceolata.AAC.3
MHKQHAQATCTSKWMSICLFNLLLILADTRNGTNKAKSGLLLTLGDCSNSKKTMKERLPLLHLGSKARALSGT